MGLFSNRRPKDEQNEAYPSWYLDEEEPSAVYPDQEHEPQPGYFLTTEDERRQLARDRSLLEQLGLL